MNRLFLVFLFIISFSGMAQEEEAPKVGLVLSGGGAKGLAHIGALKIIEEAGVKIDYIGGSSMGAIVGALYASGYTAKQLDSIFHEINFDLLIQDDIPRSAKTFYEKEETERYALTLPVDNFRISFPSGLSKGQNIYNLISRLTLHLGHERDFSKLPIPFFCIASDIETGEEVVLDSGSLPKAVSASGAIPSIFSPVRMNGRILTDGGVTNNYPVEEMKRRGAEIIIGVDVQDTLMDRDNLRSAFDILTQVSNFRTIKDMDKKIKMTNIYIKPDIRKYNMLSFDKGEAIIETGKISAREELPGLKDLAAKQRVENFQREKVKPIDTIDINSVSIEGNHDYPKSYIMGKLRLRLDRDYTLKDLHYGINNLTATGNFNRINYSLVPNEDAYSLSLQLEENPNKTFLRLALHYDDLYKSAALVNLTRKSFFATNDVASLDIILGDNFRYNFLYYLDKGFYWSLGIKSRYNSFHKGVDFDYTNQSSLFQEVAINRIEIDYQDYTNQVYIETLFKQIFSFGMGIEHKYLKITSETLAGLEQSGFNGSIFEKSHYYSTFGFLKLDSYDNKYFPTTGVYFDGDIHFYAFSSDYHQDFSRFSIAQGAVGYVFSPWGKFTTRWSSETGLRIGNDSNSSLDFFLGGFGNDLINNLVPFYGYDFMSVSGDSYVKGMVELDYEIFRKHHLIASVNFANAGNNIHSTGEWFSLPDYSGYALGYGFETFMGPLHAKYSYSPELKEGHWFFSIGFWF